MTSVADLYPEGCKLRNIRSSFEIIQWIYLAIVQFSFGSTGKDEKKKPAHIKTKHDTSSAKQSSSDPNKSKQICKLNRNLSQEIFLYSRSSIYDNCQNRLSNVSRY
jgi:hypothetical protein